MKPMCNAKWSLRKVQIDTQYYWEKKFQHKSDDSKVEGNVKHARYLRMLTLIENKIEMHTAINTFKTSQSQSNITYIEVPKDKTMDWNNIPRSYCRKHGKESKTKSWLIDVLVNVIWDI